MLKENGATKEIDGVVLEYLKAATASSDRARTVLIVMVTASVLVFTVIWNSGGWKKDNAGWFDSRIDARKTAAKLYDSIPDLKDPNLSAEQKRAIPDPKDPNLPAEQKRAFAYLEVAGLDWRDKGNQEKLQKEVAEMLKIRAEQFRIIRVPFFGVVFDMNDLGMFAGITFTVVLLWLTFSVARERRNLKLTFAEADEREQIKPCYDLLMMHQVLTVPPTRGHRFGRVSNYVPKLLYFIPVAVYALQLKTDWDSRDIGNILNPDNMWILLLTEYVFITLILILTALCFSLSLSTDRIWRGAFRKAYPNEEAREAEGQAADDAGRGDGAALVAARAEGSVTS
ncbi:MAG: hypothetical protein JOZ96_00865 [Acidobacteria bacterium]|nr:hypothetical protein [Acidobacteriota bacterium]